MKRLALFFCLLPWLAFAQVGGGVGPVGGSNGPIAGCAGPVNGCAGPLGQVSQVYVLDQLSSYPAVAYSVRQLTGGQYLPAYDMTVRRSSDNATQNIGFSGGWLNTSALLTFCAATNCYVTTWKDQGSLGSSGDATQTAAASQPQIVASGVLETQGGQPAIYFGGSQYLYNTNPFLYAAGAATTNLVFFTASASGAINLIGEQSSSNSLTTYSLGTQNGGNQYGAVFIRTNSGTVLLSNNSPMNNTPLFGVGQTIVTVTDTGSLLNLYINGGGNPIPQYYTRSGTLTPNLFNVGASNRASGQASFLIGYIQQIVANGAAMSSSDRQILEVWEGNTFGIPGVTQ